MNKSIRVILLAGGVGARMQNTTPKQFLALGDKPIALYSYECFLKTPNIEEISIVCAPEYRSLFPLPSSSIKISFASPGNRRQDSLYNGFYAEQQTTSLICIHDAARPFISPDIVTRAANAAHLYGAATVGMPLKFTIKQRNSEFLVTNTPNRSEYWEIQTPQIIQRALLLEGLEKITKENIEVTDDVSIIEQLQKKVKLIEGCERNLKITTPTDLTIAEAFLKNNE